MLDIAQTQVAGNAKVIEGLERAMVRAKKGLVRAVGIVVCEHLGSETEFWGDESARAQIVFGCETLKFMIISSCAKLQPSKPSFDLAAYDITINPICYDIINWCATAEMQRRLNNAPGPLKVCFVKSQNSMIDLSEDRMAFFQKVVRPALTLFGMVEDVGAAGGRFLDFVGNRDLAHEFVNSEAPREKHSDPVPMINPPKEIMDQVRENIIKDAPPITLTLRETDYYSYRNSNVEHWAKFARWLRKKGERVIVVRDTKKANEPFHDFNTFGMASEHLHVRAALYAQAKCNCFVQNGPWALAQFTEVPWLCFATITDDCLEECNRPDWWKKFMGLNAEGQLAWATDKQRIVFKRDTFDNMRAAYEALGL